MDKNNEQILENENKEKEKETNNENKNNELISQNIIQTEQETEKKENINNNLENILPKNKNENENIKESINKGNEDNNSIDKNNQEIEKNINKENNENELINEKISLKKEENKTIKEKEDNIKPNRKRKGYVRTLRNLIKKKHIVAKNILKKSFILWKEETIRRLTFSKTIIIRVAISKEKDEKPEGNLIESNDNKNNHFKTLTNVENDDNNNSSGIIYKPNYNLNTYNHNINNVRELMKPKEKKENQKIIPSLIKNIDKKIKLMYINNIIKNSRLITLPNRVEE